MRRVKLYLSLKKKLDLYCESCLLKLIKEEEGRINELQISMDGLNSKLVRIELDIKKMDDRINKAGSMENLLEKQTNMA